MIAHSAVSIGPEERAAVDRVLASGHIAQGYETAAFESECAQALGKAHAVAVSSGTAALHLALVAMGLRDGTRIALPAYACAALTTAVRLAGGTPQLCDIGAGYNLDAASVTGDEDAVIVPHLFGAQCEAPDKEPWIEDIAQSVGAPPLPGSTAVVASFYATKLITTGEGGMVLTGDEGLASAVRDLRGYDKRDDAALRFNYKMTDMQAAMGRVQLGRLPAFIERRRAIAARYDEAFNSLPLHLPSGKNHVYFRYVVGTPQRHALETHLNRDGIEAKRPVFAPAHHSLGGTFPGADRAHEEALSIPIYPSLDDAQVQRVIDSVLTFFD